MRTLHRGVGDGPGDGQGILGRAGISKSRKLIRVVAGLALAAIELCWAAAALAQAATPLFPGQAEPGRNVPAPAPEAPPPQFEFSIPAPRRGPVPRAVDDIEFDVSDIKIDGSTVFGPDAFKPLVDPLIGHKAKLSDIIAIADKVEALYRERGYVLTRAYVPPQTVGNGIFHVTVIEGFVKATAVEGGDDRTKSLVEAYVAHISGEKPTRIETMERGLLLANDLPGVAASGLLRPSPSEPGASDLVVNLHETPWQATVYSDNRGAVATGPVTLGAQFVANTLYYVPGQLFFDVSGTPELSQRRLFQARYTKPVGTDGATVSVSGVLAHGVPASAGGNLISQSYALGAQVAYPWLVSRLTQVSFAGGFNIQAERVTLVSDSFCTFSDDHWRTVDGAVTAQRRSLVGDSATGVTVGMTQGIPAFGANSISPCTGSEGASTGFTKFTAVANHDQPIVGGLSVNFHALAQAALERLVIGEQTSFGGSGIGRGYDPASLASDNGVGVQGELRYDLHFPKYHVETVQFYGFVDFAHTWRTEPTPPGLTAGGAQSLASTGFGMRMALLQTVTGGIEFAQQLKGVPNNDNGKTGSRILFNAAVHY